ncbi:23S rRNA (adenine(2503)-C(2))-methyltransferase RlmN [Candidatus Riflebacteria bacterium]
MNSRKVTASNSSGKNLRVKIDINELLSYSEHELKSLMKANDFKEFTGKQIFKWFHTKGIFDFSQMTDLSLACRTFLNSIVNNPVSRPILTKKSRDGTIKYLTKFPDKKMVETVAIRYKGGYTICVSTQVGCPGKCAHCYSGTIPFQRNLTAGEIVIQVYNIIRELGDIPNNIVFMGMGEPLLNTKNVLKSIEILADKKGRAISYRKFTISTVGIIPQIKKIIDFEHPINMIISLQTADPKRREELLPITKKYPLARLYQVLFEYNKTARRRISFAVSLIRDFNDRPEDAALIAKFVQGLTAHVNLIRLNTFTKALKFKGKNLIPCSDRRINEFKSWLMKEKVQVSIRVSRGDEIAAACGMLVKQTTK